MNDSRKRIIAGLLGVFFVFAVLLSAACVIHEAGHDCTGEDCPICRVIAANGAIFRLSGLALLLLFFWGAARSRAFSAPRRPCLFRISAHAGRLEDQAE